MNSLDRKGKEAGIALIIAEKLIDTFRQEIKKYKLELDGEVSNIFMMSIAGGLLTMLLKGYTHEQCQTFLDELKSTFMLWKNTMEPELSKEKQ